VCPELPRSPVLSTRNPLTSLEKVREDQCRRRRRPGILADPAQACAGFAAEWSPQSPIEAMETVCASMVGRVEPRLAWRRGEPRKTGLHGVNDLNRLVQTQPARRVAR
jgi:hypothetical protein